jgi:hypothetical protein
MPHPATPEPVNVKRYLRLRYGYPPCATRGELKSIHGKTRNVPNTQWQGVPTTPSFGANEPMYGSHQRQYIMEPIFGNPQAILCPKYIPKTPKVPPEGHQNGGSELDGLAPQPSPIQPRSTLAGADIYQKCSRSGSGNWGTSQNGSGRTCCHHRWAGFIWTRFPLVFNKGDNF